MPNRSELSTTFQRVQGMVDYVRENLDDEEYDLFLDMVAPLPEVEQGKKTAKKSTKKSPSKSSTKSARASGMAAAIGRSLGQQRQTKTVSLCVAKVDDNGGLMTCGLPADDNVHHMSSIDGYHEFDAGKSSSSAVASAGEGLSISGADQVQGASGD